MMKFPSGRLCHSAIRHHFFNGSVVQFTARECRSYTGRSRTITDATEMVGIIAIEASLLVLVWRSIPFQPLRTKVNCHKTIAGGQC
jgi:hypothetical protein